MAATGYGQAADLSRVAKSGDTMTGPLILSADPVVPLGAATEQFVLAHGGGGSGTVKSVNSVTPDSSGNVLLSASSVNALPTSSAGVPGGLALLDGAGHLSGSQVSLLLLASNNLSDVPSAQIARTSLGLGTAATFASSAFLQPSNNLSDLGSATLARTNLGLGSAATLSSSGVLQPGNNLSDVGSAGTARTNLGLGSAAVQPVSAFLQTANNFSDVPSAAAARTNLGLGSASTLSSSAFLQPSNNLSDVGSAGTARTNLGLGSAAVQNVGSFLQPSNNLSDLASAGTARASLGLGAAATQPLSSFLQPGNNLSDVGSAALARTNLGLTALATSSFDIVAADYQPIGTPNPGATGKVADAGHVHPYWPWQFPPTLYGAKGDGQVDNTASMSSGSNVLTVNTSRFSSASDVGKLVMVPRAISAFNVAGQTNAVGTITAVNSPTQVQLSFTATVAVSSGQVLWSTDDTVAFQTSIGNATAYGSAHGYGEVLIPPPPGGLFYGVGGNLKTSDGVNTAFNSQLTCPIISDRNNGVTLAFRGVGDSGWTRHWNAQYPAINTATIISFGVFDTAAHQSTTGTNAINNAGNPSVIGGPTGKFGYGVGTPQPTYSNMGVLFEDITILTTHSNSGWTYGAANMFGVSRFHARNFSYGTTGVVELYNNNSGDFNNVTLLSGGLSIGLLLPGNGNNASNYLNNVVCNGGYTYGLVATEHTVGNDVTILYCWSGVCPCGNYTDSGSGAVSALHASWFDQLCVEACTYHLNVFGAGAPGPIFHAVMDTEGTIQIRDNPNNGTALAAATGEIRLTGSASTVNLTFPTGLRIIKEQNLPGVNATPPALVANTAVMNNLWRPATVLLSGGTGITTIQVSNLAGGVSSAAVTTLADLTSLGTISTSASPPFPVRLGPGQWIQVNLAGAGSALPTAKWVLD